MTFEMARTTRLFIKEFSKIKCHFVPKKWPNIIVYETQFEKSNNYLDIDECKIDFGKILIFVNHWNRKHQLNSVVCQVNFKNNMSFSSL